MDPNARRLEDLDPATRKLVDQAIGRRSTKGTSGRPARQRPRPSGVAPKSGNERWRCECGQEFTVWARVEKHPTGPGHTRIAIVLNPVTPAP